MSCDKFFELHKQFLAIVAAVFEPTKFSKEITNLKWYEAMKLEIEALGKNKTWDIVPLPLGKWALGSKWVYDIKYKADGTIERYKDLLVILGNTQHEGIDFTNIFALVAKLVTNRTLLSVAFPCN